MDKSMTVGELKKALLGIPDNLPVYLDIPALTSPKVPISIDWNYYVKHVGISLRTSISNDHFSIMAGDGFGW